MTFYTFFQIFFFSFVEIAWPQLQFSISPILTKFSARHKQQRRLHSKPLLYLSLDTCLNFGQENVTWILCAVYRDFPETRCMPIAHSSSLIFVSCCWNTDDSWDIKILRNGEVMDFMEQTYYTSHRLHTSRISF